MSVAKMSSSESSFLNIRFVAFAQFEAFVITLLDALLKQCVTFHHPGSMTFDFFKQFLS